jgi:ribonuclease P protein component
VVGLFFKSNLRIKNSIDFVTAFRSKSLNNKWFVIYLQDSKTNSPRLGMVVSKRVIPKSVFRNYAKRVIRETFRLNLPELPAMDFIVKIKRNLNKNTADEARSALIDLLLSAGIR